MIRLWESEVGMECYSRKVDADTIVFSPDGQLLATSSYNDGLKIWDSTSGKLLHTIKDHDFNQQPRFSADGWSIETSRGAILLPSSIRPNDIQGTRACSLSVVNQWLVCNSKKILWLPHGYEPLTVATRDNVIAMITRREKVIFMSFDFQGGPGGNDSHSFLT
jgi:WD40 repeat protein